MLTKPSNATPITVPTTIIYAIMSRIKSILSITTKNIYYYYINDIVPMVFDVTFVINITDPKTTVDINMEAPIRAL